MAPAVNRMAEQSHAMHLCVDDGLTGHCIVRGFGSLTGTASQYASAVQRWIRSNGLNPFDPTPWFSRAWAQPGRCSSGPGRPLGLTRLGLLVGLIWMHGHSARVQVLTTDCVCTRACVPVCAGVTANLPV